MCHHHQATEYFKNIIWIKKITNLVIRVASWEAPVCFSAAQAEIFVFRQMCFLRCVSRHSGFPSFCSLPPHPPSVFEAWFCYVAHTGVELKILLLDTGIRDTYTIIPAPRVSYDCFLAFRTCYGDDINASEKHLRLQAR